jgi:hypothetical protein
MQRVSIKLTYEHVDNEFVMVQLNVHMKLNKKIAYNA